MRFALFSLTLAAFHSLSAQIINIEYGPTHYYSAADSPFYAGIQACTIYLEDFEDGQLNTPDVISAGFFWRGRVTRLPGVAGYVNSVDADDGLKGDFRGGEGNSWSNFARFSEAPGQYTHEFLFSSNELGQYPTYVGFVVTLVGEVDTDVGFGGWGALTGDVFASDGFDPRLFVSRPYESTTNHYFLGLYNSEGFRNVIMTNVDELDHLQYGYSIAGVPEPSTYALMGLGLAVVACLARRRR